MILLQRNIIDNMIAELRNANGDFLYENYDKTSINSIESNLGFKFNQFNLELSYNYTNVTDEIEYKRLPNISEHMININLFYELYDLKLINFNLPKMRLISNINYYSDKILIAPTSGQETYIPDFYQINISSVLKDIPYKNIDLKFGINNILDYTNFDDKTFQNPGLTYKMEIFYKYEFK